MQKNYTNLLSPAGIALRSYILRDPLGLGSETRNICKISSWKPTTRFMTNISSPKTVPPLLMFITPVFSTGSTGKNDELIKILEEELKHVQENLLPFELNTSAVPPWESTTPVRLRKIPSPTSSLALLIIIVFISLVLNERDRYR